MFKNIAGYEIINNYKKNELNGGTFILTGCKYSIYGPNKYANWEYREDLKSAYWGHYGFSTYTECIIDAEKRRYK